MIRKYWKVILIIFVLADTASCLFAIFAGGNSFFSHWVSIGKPPETVTRIIGINIGDTPFGMINRGRETRVFVESATGKIFQCCENDSASSWTQSDQIDSNEAIFLDCGTLGNSNTFHLPDEKDQHGVMWCGENDYGTIVYSLREDGTVWSRKIYGSPMRTFWLQFITVGITVLLLIVIIILDLVFLVFNNLVLVLNKWKTGNG